MLDLTSVLVIQVERLNKQLSYTRLEFRKEVWAGNINFRINRMYLAFEATNLGEIVVKEVSVNCGPGGRSVVRAGETARKWLSSGSRQMIRIQRPYWMLGQPGGTARVLASRRVCVVDTQLFQAYCTVRLPLEEENTHKK